MDYLNFSHLRLSTLKIILIMVHVEVTGIKRLETTRKNINYKQSLINLEPIDKINRLIFGGV